MRKTIFTLFVAVCTVFAMTGLALADGQIVLKTTVPNIPKSACYQGGTITMELDDNTVLSEGDVIQFTLSNNVKLCKTINYYLKLHDGVVVNDAMLVASDENDPVTSTDTAADNLAIDVVRAGFDYGFLVRGNNGSQILTLTVARRNTATGAVAIAGTDFTLTFNAAAATNNVLIVKLFDEKNNGGYFYKNAGDTTAADYIADNAYKTANGLNFTPDDNTICINTLAYAGEYVEASPDSIPDNVATFGTKLSFSGDYRIAHVLSETAYKVVSCTGKNAGVAGNINYPISGQVGCTNFDFEGTTGYCSNHTGDNQIIIESKTPFPVDKTYKVKLEVLVNGKTGENGVYWTNVAPIRSKGYDNLTSACGASLLTVAENVPTKYYRANGTTQVTGNTGGSCSVTAAKRAVIAMTTSSTLGLNLVSKSNDYLYIDIPPLTFDTTQVKKGDTVSVKVSLEMDPCGDVGVTENTINLGTFGCGSSVTSSLLFPYFTNPSETYFWSAFTITNLSNAAGNITLYLYENDGDVFKGVVGTSVAANTVWFKGTLTQMLEDGDINWTQTSGTGDMGDDMCYVVACTDFAADGFALIASSASGESTGYLPRTNLTDGAVFGAGFVDICK